MAQDWFNTWLTIYFLKFALKSLCYYLYVSIWVCISAVQLANAKCKIHLITYSHSCNQHFSFVKTGICYSTSLYKVVSIVSMLGTLNEPAAVQWSLKGFWKMQSTLSILVMQHRNRSTLSGVLTIFVCSSIRILFSTFYNFMTVICATRICDSNCTLNCFTKASAHDQPILVPSCNSSECNWQVANAIALCIYSDRGFQDISDLNEIYDFLVVPSRAIAKTIRPSGYNIPPI